MTIPLLLQNNNLYSLLKNVKKITPFRKVNKLSNYFLEKHKHTLLINTNDSKKKKKKQTVIHKNSNDIVKDNIQLPSIIIILSYIIIYTIKIKEL